MRIGVSEGGSYMRGLLLLARKDCKITRSEIGLFTQAGVALGYCPRFCTQAIAESLTNRYIEEVIPEFSSQSLCRMFIADGLALASSDDEIHRAEESWLASVADKHGLETAWFARARLQAVRNAPAVRLESERITLDPG
jgi:hypothetical protein